MLRFRRDRAFVGIASDALSYVRLAGGRSRSIVDHGTRPLVGQNAVTVAAALESLIATADLRGTDLSVTLADRLVRHFVVERPNGARSRQEIELAARLRFADIFSLPTDEWVLQIALQPLATRLLACAAPRQLLTELSRQGARAKVRLRSIRAFAHTEADRIRAPQQDSSRILVIVAPDSIWLARAQGRDWHSAFTHPVKDGVPATLPRLLQQEHLKMPDDAPPPAIWAGGAVTDPALRQQLKEQSIQLSGAPAWPGKDQAWCEHYRLALSPIWPSCA